MANSITGTTVSDGKAPSTPAPAVRNRRRFRPQFGLSSVLVATTVVALLLGMVVEPAWRQHDAKARLRDLGVDLTFNIDPAQSAWSRAWSGWIGGLTGDETFDDLIDAEMPEAAFGDPATIDAALDQLARLPRVSSLGLFGAAIGGEQLKRVSRLRGLQDLRVYGNALTDDDLQHLAALTELTNLAIQAPITGSGLSHLAGLKKLKALSIHASIADDSLAHLRPLKELTFLFINGPITDAALDQIARLTQLEYLNLWSPNVSDAGMPRLAPLVHLHRLVCLRRGSANRMERLRVPRMTPTTALPLDKAMQLLATYHQSPWKFDQAALAEAGINPEVVQVEIELRNDTLAKVLRRALSPHGLVCMEIDGSLVVTTRASDERAHAGINQLRAALPNLWDVTLDW